MRILDIIHEGEVVPFPQKKKPVRSGTDEITGLPLTPSESEFLCVDLDTGKVLSTHPSLREAAIAKRQWEQWGKKSVGIQEI